MLGALRICRGLGLDALLLKKAAGVSPGPGSSLGGCRPVVCRIWSLPTAPRVEEPVRPEKQVVFVRCFLPPGGGDGAQE